MLWNILTIGRISILVFQNLSRDHVLKYSIEVQKKLPMIKLVQEIWIFSEVVWSSFELIEPIRFEFQNCTFTTQYVVFDYPYHIWISKFWLII